MKKFLAVLVSALFIAGGASAAPVTFNISLETALSTSTGTFIIEDSLIAPDAKVYTKDIMTSINLDGRVFTTPYSGTTEYLQFDAAGEQILSVGDDRGSYLDFRDSTGAYSFVQLIEGVNGGLFTSYGLGGLTGTFEITRAAISAVPLPAGLPLFAAGMAGLVWLRRRKSAA